MFEIDIFGSNDFPEGYDISIGKDGISVPITATRTLQLAFMVFGLERANVSISDGPYIPESLPALTSRRDFRSDG